MGKLKSINIPDECHKHNFDFRKVNNGDFCRSCQKTVIDFTDFSSEEIINFFEKLDIDTFICGQFKREQLTAINIDLLPQRSYQKYLIALLTSGIISTSSVDAKELSIINFLQNDIIVNDISQTQLADSTKKLIDSKHETYDIDLEAQYQILENITPTDSNKQIIKGRLKNEYHGTILTGIPVYSIDGKISVLTNQEGIFIIECDKEIDLGLIRVDYLNKTNFIKAEKIKNKFVDITFIEERVSDKLFNEDYPVIGSVKIEVDNPILYKIKDKLKKDK